MVGIRHFLFVSGCSHPATIIHSLNAIFDTAALPAESVAIVFSARVQLPDTLPAHRSGLIKRELEWLSGKLNAALAPIKPSLLNAP